MVRPTVDILFFNRHGSSNFYVWGFQLFWGILHYWGISFGYQVATLAIIWPTCNTCCALLVGRVFAGAAPRRSALSALRWHIGGKETLVKGSGSNSRFSCMTRRPGKLHFHTVRAANLSPK